MEGSVTEGQLGDWVELRGGLESKGRGHCAGGLVQVTSPIRDRRFWVI